VWHFVTKSAGLKSVNPGMSSHFSESRDPSYVSLAMCPECPRKYVELSPSSYSLHPQESDLKFVQGPGGVTASPTLVPSWCGARTILNCCWSWGISSPPKAAVPTTLPKGKAGTQMSMYAYIFEPCYLWNCP